MATATETPVKKTSKSETGHAKNAANFEQLVTYVASLGAVYNPSKESLNLKSLQGLLDAAKNSLGAVNDAYALYSNAIAEREAAFKQLTGIVTRAGNALKIADATDEIKQNGVSILRKLQGRRISAKLTEEEKQKIAEQGIQKTQISSSQMSFDSRIENLDKFVKLLASIPSYAPNETDLKIESLTALHANLKEKNTAVMTADAPLTNARISRNDIMYKEKTGLVDISADVKLYLKSISGIKGSQYKAISNLSFKTYRV